MGMKLIMLGAPGAGKGTQAEILSDRLGIPAISTGNILRVAIQEGNPLGLEIKARIDEGKLAPDPLVIDIVTQRLAQPDCAGGFILDGMPRTLAQAQALDQAGIVFDRAISLEVSEEEIIERMAGRRVCQSCGASFHVEARPPKQEGVCDCCGGALARRCDDEPETVRRRLKIYHAETEPLKGYFAEKGILSSVVSQPTIEATAQVVAEALGR